MNYVNDAKASLVISRGDKIMASFDVNHIDVEVQDVATLANKSGEVDVHIDGKSDVSLLSFLLNLKNPGYVEKRVFPPFKWVRPEALLPKISRVIFNYPATIILWDDGTKSVVKCQREDVYDTEKGIMACMLKRFMGNDNTFNKVLNRWVKEDV